MLYLILLMVIFPSIAYAETPCLESPNGVFTCDQHVARDNNALPTPIANALRQTGNNAAIGVMPTPVSNTCYLFDMDATATDECVLTNGTTIMHIPPRSSELPTVLVTTKSTTPYTLTATEDEVVLCNAASGAITLNLPAAATAGSGRRHTIKKIDSSGFACTIDGNGTETIDGNLTMTISFQNTAVSIVSDGSDWWIF